METIVLWKRRHVVNGVEYVATTYEITNELGGKWMRTEWITAERDNQLNLF